MGREGVPAEPKYPIIVNADETAYETEGRQVDPVEKALAVAIERASLSGNWETVKVLASELRARRQQLDGPAERINALRS